MQNKLLASKLSSVKFSAIKQFYNLAKVWLHVTLTYVFIAAIVATLICAYLQEIDAIVITVLLLIGGLYGSFKAESIRRTSGLLTYKTKLQLQHSVD